MAGRVGVALSRLTGRGSETFAPAVDSKSLPKDPTSSTTEISGLANEALLGSGVGKDAVDTAQSGPVAFVDGSCMSMSASGASGVLGVTGGTCVERGFVGLEDAVVVE